MSSAILLEFEGNGRGPETATPSTIGENVSYLLEEEEAGAAAANL